MAAIYDKALKRKDYSGIVNKDKKPEEASEPPISQAESKRVYSSLRYCGRYLILYQVRTKQRKRRKRNRQPKLTILKQVLMLARLLTSWPEMLIVFVLVLDSYL